MMVESFNQPHGTHHRIWYRNAVTDKSRPRAGDVIANERREHRPGCHLRSIRRLHQSVSRAYPAQRKDRLALSEVPLETAHYQNRMEVTLTARLLRPYTSHVWTRLQVAIPPLDNSVRLPTSSAPWTTKSS